MPESLRSGTAATNSSRACRRSTQAMRERFEAARGARPACCAMSAGWTPTHAVPPSAWSSWTIAPVRQHQPDRQRRPLHDEPLRPKSARRARPRRRPRRHRRRRVRRSAARLRLSRGARVSRPPDRARRSRRPASATSPSVSTFSATAVRSPAIACAPCARAARASASPPSRGVVTDLPRDPEQNTAGMAVAAMVEATRMLTSDSS